MVAPLNKKKMSHEDRLNYLHNELDQLKIKKQRYQQDSLRPKKDLEFYIKCNDYFLEKIQQEIKVIKAVLNN
jgi:hypothetical protein